MRNEIALTDEQIEAVFEELGVGTTADSLVFTRDTLADFREASKGWAALRRASDDEVEGFAVLTFEGAQSAKGQPRRDVYVVDFGAVRVVYQ